MTIYMTIYIYINDYIYDYIYIYIYNNHNKSFVPTYLWLTLVENVKPLAWAIRRILSIRIRRLCVLKIAVEIAMNSGTLLQFEPVTINI